MAYIILGIAIILLAKYYSISKKKNLTISFKIMYLTDSLNSNISAYFVRAYVIWGVAIILLAKYYSISKKKNFTIF